MVILMVGYCWWMLVITPRQAAAVGRLEKYIFDVSTNLRQQSLTKYEQMESGWISKFREVPSSLRMTSRDSMKFKCHSRCFPASRSPIAFWALQNNSASVSAWPRAFWNPIDSCRSFRIRTEIPQGKRPKWGTQRTQVKATNIIECLHVWEGHWHNTCLSLGLVILFDLIHVDSLASGTLLIKFQKSRLSTSEVTWSYLDQSACHAAIQSTKIQ